MGVAYFIEKNFLTNFHEDQCKLIFSCDWSCNSVDLVFNCTCPTFKLGLKIIEMNILTNFHEDKKENVTSKVLTDFFYDVPRLTTMMKKDKDDDGSMMMDL
ncbi:hypothetical protein DPMN_084691 [Dreissena polymorpha]|uniref:Uncharacterized protein n=1 Tax=Dreissena polymorpha TaxID=45954 RepID=A0A9D3YF09_DREPO|nr:hypothetical protein DPMN_084691 [Dreissena polymorpha]